VLKVVLGNDPEAIDVLYSTLERDGVLPATKYTLISLFTALCVHGPTVFPFIKLSVANPLGWVSAIRDISHRKSLELRLAYAAATDSLTGLANRRAFDALLDHKIGERRAAAGNSCVAIFDIDFFKRVNDAHGHAVGDLVLETFAAAALRTLRAGDHVARLGGEEFGLILNNADLKQAAQVCDRLRMAVALDITHAPGDVAVSITVSAGIAQIDGSKTRLQVMRAADDALYRAKAGGRDQLAIAA